MNLRGRMGLAGALVIAGTLGVIAPMLYSAESGVVSSEFDTALAGTAEQTSGIDYEVELKQAFVTEKTRSKALPIVELGGALVQTSGSPTVGGGAAGFPPYDTHDIAVFNGTAPSFASDFEYDGVVYRMYTTRTSYSEPPTEPGGDYTTYYTLARAARKLSDETAPLHRLELLMIVLASCGALLAMLVMALLSGRILRPVHRLTAAVEHVTATGDLTTDLGVGPGIGSGIGPGAGRRRRGKDELGRLAASFGVMMRALDDSLQAQRRLVADASHELRTPLTSLTTNLDLLDEISGSPDPLTPELVRDARSQAHELRALVNDLIDLARFASVETHAEDTRLDLLAEQAVKRTRELATARTREIRFESDLEQCLAAVDPDAVHRAVGNLLNNAVKWSPVGGAIRVSLRATDDGHAELDVRDEGPGIPSRDLPYVFDRFYRSPAARSMPGSGLGLAIVRQIAEQHHGSVAALESSTGAHIRLRLPLIEQSAEPEPDAAVEPRHRPLTPQAS